MKKRLVTVLIFLLLSAMACACGSTSIVGSWKNERGELMGFFPDGTAYLSAEDRTCTYSAENGRLRLTDGRGSDLWSYYISGGTLEIAWDGGASTWKRVRG